MKVLVFTFERTEGGIIAVIDPANTSSIRSIQSSQIHGSNSIVKLINGADFGFNPSSFNGFLSQESTKEEMVELHKAMTDGDIDSQGIKLIGMDGLN